MVDTKITDLTSLTTPASNDVLVIVDVSDSTMGPSGTNKKISLSDTTKYTITSTSSATYNETATGGNNVILANAASNAITINLPTAVGNTATFSIKKTDSSANTVTIDADTTETIDGDSTAIIKYQNTSITLVSDNSGWRII